MSKLWFRSRNGGGGEVIKNKNKNNIGRVKKKKKW